MLLSACGAPTTTPEPTPTPTPTTVQKRVELLERLQQVNDAIAINMEQIFEVTGNISVLYDQQNSSKLRELQARSDPNDTWTVYQEQSNQSHYMTELMESKGELRELQNKQLELEKERNQLLIELAKLE